MAVERKNRNSGFTLVELLVAITILAIVVIPLLHAFVSSARTNNKAYRTHRATSIAENIMEEFEDASMAELETKYAVLQNPDGTYQFQFTPAQLSEFGSDEFTAEVFLDPNTSYSLYNQKSLVDVAAITALNNAVYAMAERYDENVYDIFKERSQSAYALDSTLYKKEDVEFFKKELNRNMSIVLQKGSMITDTEGNTFPSVKVTIDIVYEYRNNATHKALLPEDIKYSVQKDLFDNTSSKEPLNAIYIIYTPRYKACCDAGKKDEIMIRNDGNVEADLFIISQQTPEDASYRNTYLAQKKAKVTVYENPTWPGAFTPNTPAALSLRTNLHSTPNPLNNEVQLKSELIYRSNTQIASESVSEKILDTKRPDGKAFDGKALKERIYSMKVTVFEAGETTPFLVLDGTKID